MWQAMLMSAGVANSKQIMIHGFITSGGQKMSKSLGNVVDPFALVEKYGTDALRYFLLREMSPFEDGDFTAEKFAERYTADLANGLGNLVARVAALGEKVGPIEIKEMSARPDMPPPPHYDELMSGYHFKNVLEWLWQEFSGIDKYINDQKLWEQEEKIMKHGIVACALGIRYKAKLLEPFMPGTAKKIIETFAIQGDVLTSKKGTALFPRVG